MREYVDNFGNVLWSGAVNYASEALGVNLESLSSKDYHFLENTNLMDMLRHHGIDHP